MTAADLSAIAAHVVAHPTDEVRWLVLADYLDDRGDGRGAKVRRWWKVRPELVRVWGAETPAAGGLEEAAAACVDVGGEWWRLAACLNWRLCRERWPVPYEMITTWPAGWSSARHESVVADAVDQVELAAFGLADPSAARAAADAARSAASVAGESVRSAAMSAAMSARSAARSAAMSAWAVFSAAVRSAKGAAEVAGWAVFSAAVRSAKGAAEVAGWAVRAARGAVRSAEESAAISAARRAAARLYYKADDTLP